MMTDERTGGNLQSWRMYCEAPLSEQYWPIWVHDKSGRRIYITEERWQHALDHPGMHVGLLGALLQTIRSGQKRQDAYDPTKYKYSKPFPNLPGNYTHLVVVVKFGLTRDAPVRENNFVLTAYLIEKWADG